VKIFAIYLLVRNAIVSLRTRTIDEEQQEIRLDALNVGHGRIYNVCSFAVTSEKAETFRVARKRVRKLVGACYRSVRQAPEVDEWVRGAFVVEAKYGQHALFAQQVLHARCPLCVSSAQCHNEGGDRTGPNVYRLTSDVVARMYALGADMAVLAIDGRRRCQRRVSGRRRGEAVGGRRDLCDAADGVFQFAQRLLRLLQFSANPFPVL
jgi:hypothetical protein